MGKATPIRKEIRDEIVSLVKSGISVREASERYGVSTKAIYNWLGRTGKSEQSEALELSRLRRENEALYQILGRMTYRDSLAGKKS